ncbi:MULTISPECIES: hypothetical protein [Roseateles]|uniref:Uncharacterized protein n=1 Tax=Roseateles albus TaxID=2987525 RepID=A0ABT5KGJ0_9BURK|nr:MULTISPECIES: hypothetical protein [Roseateles]MCV2358269.1 hypothetical protein [Paucibacter sp. TC2R-5]MDC8772574.1 hypothetical protein [Roseateles albus]
MKKTTLSLVAALAAFSLIVMQVSLVTVGHSGGGSTTLLLRHQAPKQLNFFESIEHACAQAIPRESCEAELKSALAKHGLLTLPYSDTVKSLSLPEN